MATTSPNEETKLDDEGSPVPDLSEPVSFRPAFLRRAPPHEASETRTTPETHPQPAKPLYIASPGRLDPAPLLTSYEERPTDLARRIYTRDFLQKARKPPSVYPPFDAVSSLKMADLWLEDYTDDKPSSVSREDESRSWIADKKPMKPRDIGAQFRASFQNLLNKLTVDKFDTLYGKILELLRSVQSVSQLEEAVAMLHRKAVTDAKFVGMYASAVQALNKDLKPIPDPASGGKPLHFRALLLNKCQEVFEATIRPADPAEMGDEDERLLWNKSGVANIVFLGELFKIGLLPAKLLLGCVEMLLQKVKEGLASKMADGPQLFELSCEKLSRLLLSVGEQMEGKPAVKGQFDQIMDDLGALSRMPSLPARPRYLLQDVLDSRAKGWEQRRKVQGPTTIDAIHAKSVAAEVASFSKQDDRRPPSPSLKPASSSPTSSPSLSGKATTPTGGRVPAKPGSPSLDGKGSSPTSSPSTSPNPSPASLAGTKRTVVRRVVYDSSAQKESSDQ